MRPLTSRCPGRAGWDVSIDAKGESDARRGFPKYSECEGGYKSRVVRKVVQAWIAGKVFDISRCTAGTSINYNY
jgi:hypothetical protein